MEEKEYKMIMEALHAARNAFYKIIEDDYGYDGIYYTLDLKVTVLGLDFEPLRVIEDKVPQPNKEVIV